MMMKKMAAPSLFILLMACQPSVSEYDPSAYALDTISQSQERGAVAATKRALDRIDRINQAGPEINAVLSVNPDALSIAKALAKEDPRGPLHGVPVLLKDNIDTRDNLPTTAGSRVLLNNFAAQDAPVAASLREAGVVILGKANLSQWANFRSESSVSGWSAIGGQTRNPHVLNRNTCGSSSGSGAAVAAGIVPAAIGTETNGSIICPSSMNGIVGFKPTIGVVPQDGIVPIASSQDTAGPMTLTVEDAAIVMDALSGEGGAYHAVVKAGSLDGLRIGVLDFARGDFEPLGELFQAALDTMEAQGAVLVPIETYSAGDGFGQASYDLLKYEFKATLNDYLSKTPPAVAARTLSDVIAATQADPIEMHVFNADIMEASDALGDLTSEAYLSARETVGLATRENGIDKMLADFDVDILVAPSTNPSFVIDHIYGDTYPGGAGAGWIAAIAGYPHLTVPMGAHKHLPVGISFMGAKGDDKAVMAAGHAYEVVSRKRVNATFIPSLESLPLPTIEESVETD